MSEVEESLCQSMESRYVRGWRVVKSEDDDNEWRDSKRIDLYQDRPTQVTLVNGSPVRQTRAKTYNSSAQDGRFKDKRQLSEDDDATLLKNL